MPSCTRLIEVAFPIREVSAESVRDKSLRHGHISTLHLWWARRPLAACRAIIFASLVPDPDDAGCPPEFRSAVERLLKQKVPTDLKSYARGREHVRDDDPYKPYDGIEDTLRNRLLAFIAKWSPEALAFEKGKRTKEADPDQLLDDRSLTKWETSDPENEQGRAVLAIARELVKVAHGGRAPSVFDPFSGGGAIPLEAGRLGAQPVANDYSPVAYLILRATCEFPQRFGKPGKRMVEREEYGTKKKEIVQQEVPNVLAHDIEQWCKWILERARERVGYLYPTGVNKCPVLGYLWARTAPCSNPTCRAAVPLLKSLLICNRKDRRVALTMLIEKKSRTVEFGIAIDGEITSTDGTMLKRGNVRCPFCDEQTSVESIREAGHAGALGERMVAVIELRRVTKTRSRRGEDATVTVDEKSYRPVEPADLRAFDAAIALMPERPAEQILPEVHALDAAEAMSNSTGIRVHLYGMTTWGALYNPRQLVLLHTLTDLVSEVRGRLLTECVDPSYRSAVLDYLGLWVSRMAMFQTTVGRWLSDLQAVTHPFNRAAVSMVWDYPEASPFADSSGGGLSQLDWMLRFVRRESAIPVPARVTRGDSAHMAIPSNSIDVVVTDPPYFDEAAYADLSDFFYVWLKRVLGEEFPEVLATPQTPKADEATALRHRHAGNAAAADRHFGNKLAQVFTEAKRITVRDGLSVVIFAHQETEAWTALINSLFVAGVTIDATWPVEMERKSRPRGINSAALETSIAVVCRPRSIGGAASFKDVRREIELVVAASVKRFWSYGFRGADLIVACYGPAVGVFGKYERVEKASGDLVDVPELLALARTSARDAIAGEFKADSLSTLYYVWVTMYGPGEQAWDDARLVVQIGGDAESALDIASKHGIFVVDGSTCRLALLADRAERRGLGSDPSPPLIDALHHSMLLWKEERRPELVAYLAARDLLEDGPFWKLAQALFEVMPRDLEDWKLVSALLTERQTLRTEGKKVAARREIGLFDGPL
jgi:adenine-specific DNA methylase